MMWNQSMVGSKLPELSEAAEQEKGNGCSWPRIHWKTTFPLQSDGAKGVHILDVRESPVPVTRQRRQRQHFVPLRLSFLSLSSRTHACCLHFPAAGGMIAKPRETRGFIVLFETHL